MVFNNNNNGMAGTTNNYGRRRRPRGGGKPTKSAKARRSISDYSPLNNKNKGNNANMTEIRKDSDIHVRLETHIEAEKSKYSRILNWADFNVKLPTDETKDLSGGCLRFAIKPSYNKDNDTIELLFLHLSLEVSQSYEHSYNFLQKVSFNVRVDGAIDEFLYKRIDSKLQHTRCRRNITKVIEDGEEWNDTTDYSAWILERKFWNGQMDIDRPYKQINYKPNMKIPTKSIPYNELKLCTFNDLHLGNGFDDGIAVMIFDKPMYGDLNANLEYCILSISVTMEMINMYQKSEDDTSFIVSTRNIIAETEIDISNFVYDEMAILEKRGIEEEDSSLHSLITNSIVPPVVHVGCNDSTERFNNSTSSTASTATTLTATTHKSRKVRINDYDEYDHDDDDDYYHNNDSERSDDAVENYDYYDEDEEDDENIEILDDDDYVDDTNNYDDNYVENYDEDVVMINPIDDSKEAGTDYHGQQHQQYDEDSTVDDDIVTSTTITTAANDDNTTSNNTNTNANIDNETTTRSSSSIKTEQKNNMLLEQAEEHESYALRLYKKKNYKKCIKQNKKCLGIRESVLGRYNEETSNVYYQLGLSYFKNGKAEKGIAAYYTSIRINHYINDESSENKNVIVYDEFKKWFAKKGINSTEDKIKSYLTNLKHSVQYEKDGDNYRTNGEFISAIEHYNKAIELESNCIGSTITLPFLVRKVSYLVFLSTLVNGNQSAILRPINWFQFDTIDKKRNKQMNKLLDLKNNTNVPNPLQMIQAKQIFETMLNGDIHHASGKYKESLEYYDKVNNENMDYSALTITETNYQPYNSNLLLTNGDNMDNVKEETTDLANIIDIIEITKTDESKQCFLEPIRIMEYFGDVVLIEDDNDIDTIEQLTLNGYVKYETEDDESLTASPRTNRKGTNKRPKKPSTNKKLVTYVIGPPAQDHIRIKFDLDYIRVGKLWDTRKYFEFPSSYRNKTVKCLKQEITRKSLKCFNMELSINDQSLLYKDIELDNDKSLLQQGIFHVHGDDCIYLKYEKSIIEKTLKSKHYGLTKDNKMKFWMTKYWEGNTKSSTPTNTITDDDDDDDENLCMINIQAEHINNQIGINVSQFTAKQEKINTTSTSQIVQSQLQKIEMKVIVGGQDGKKWEYDKTDSYKLKEKHKTTVKEVILKKGYNTNRDQQQQHEANNNKYKNRKSFYIDDKNGSIGGNSSTSGGSASGGSTSGGYGSGSNSSITSSTNERTEIVKEEIKVIEDTSFCDRIERSKWILERKSNQWNEQHITDPNHYNKRLLLSSERRSCNSISNRNGSNLHLECEDGLLLSMKFDPPHQQQGYDDDNTTNKNTILKDMICTITLSMELVTRFETTDDRLPTFNKCLISTVQNIIATGKENISQYENKYENNEEEVKEKPQKKEGVDEEQKQVNQKKAIKGILKTPRRRRFPRIW